MRFNRLDLNLLVTLDALLGERRITRAAERLNLSQSAISGMLAKLRDYFEDELLIPVGRNLELTPLARELAQPVRDLLLQVQTIVAIDPTFDPAHARHHFKIATSDYVVNVLMPRVMPTIAQLAPHITLELMPQVDDSAAKLRRGEYDFLIIPEPFIASDHPSLPLFDDSYVCVVWEGNDGVADRLSVAEFERLDHVAALLGWPRAPTYDSRYLEAQGIRRSVRITTSDFSSMAPVLIGTRMVATMHRRLATELARRLPLRLVEPPIPIPAVREFLQWHVYREKDPCHRWLREQLVDAAAGLAGR
ncbi:LysR family transcriptional regulator [Robbsia andropogonis]|uniref:LysR family transcriptional regulator n=1 Tax=Robbsia andropogonis TaxID=28092 RepID=A0A0F5JTW6_9BURK|nr:LysR family transcriptional regulator [Robbsia andropogonis]KKB61085.1 LysR family transcriptional regulator [Robbsia andropogonis]MCP1118676.1 LysR family transcriptional regulator [Robbsia andropogonis]MCP1128143.1 LysR family transcriptional regulator [Robbsia andropogonis]